MIDQPNSNEQIGHRIRQRRKELKMSASILATAADISTSQLYQHERGNFSITALRLQKIAVQLNVHFDYFFR